ncbi:hypothetical protein HOG48_04075 [Candidatus Peregrinibacteria bacterium]|jgi:hypothetical protein|nr:hypothetical protein [Candidatus Peregrinibacteria bacterium]
MTEISSQRFGEVMLEMLSRMESSKDAGIPAAIATKVESLRADLEILKDVYKGPLLTFNMDNLSSLNFAISDRILQDEAPEKIKDLLITVDDKRKEILRELSENGLTAEMIKKAMDRIDLFKNLAVLGVLSSLIAQCFAYEFSKGEGVPAETAFKVFCALFIIYPLIGTLLKSVPAKVTVGKEMIRILEELEGGEQEDGEELPCWQPREVMAGTEA